MRWILDQRILFATDICKKKYILIKFCRICSHIWTSEPLCFFGFIFRTGCRSRSWGRSRWLRPFMLEPESEPEFAKCRSRSRNWQKGWAGVWARILAGSEAGSNTPFRFRLRNIYIYYYNMSICISLVAPDWWGIKSDQKVKGILLILLLSSLSLNLLSHS